MAGACDHRHASGESPPQPMRDDGHNYAILSVQFIASQCRSSAMQSVSTGYAGSNFDAGALARADDRARATYADHNAYGWYAFRIWYGMVASAARMRELNGYKPNKHRILPQQRAEVCRRWGWYMDKFRYRP
jgi:hypothetical protein